jgi:hypothetical protein
MSGFMKCNVSFVYSYLLVSLLVSTSRPNILAAFLSMRYAEIMCFWGPLYNISFQVLKLHFTISSQINAFE